MTLSSDITIFRIAAAQPYLMAAQEMEAIADDLALGKGSESIWFLEHPHVYTLGRSAKRDDVLHIQKNTPIVETRRGGQVTYHGPGQRIVWLVLHIHQHAPHVRAFVHMLQNWTIASLDQLGVSAFTHPKHIGVWARHASGMDVKLIAFGLRMRRGISRYGFAVNVAPDLSYYNSIIPCGVREPNLGVSSISSVLSLQMTKASGYGASYDLPHEHVGSTTISTAPADHHRPEPVIKDLSSFLPDQVTMADLDRALLASYPDFFKPGFQLCERKSLPVRSL